MHRNFSGPNVQVLSCGKNDLKQGVAGKGSSGFFSLKATSIGDSKSLQIKGSSAPRVSAPRRTNPIILLVADLGGLSA